MKKLAYTRSHFVRRSRSGSPVNKCLAGFTLWRVFYGKRVKGEKSLAVCVAFLEDFVLRKVNVFF